MNKENKTLLNSKQVSKYLSISLRTLQKLSKKGKIKAIKIGRDWRYYKSDIERYLSVGTDFSAATARRCESLNESRVYPRINCSLPCYINITIPEEKELFSEAKILNISQGGVFIRNYNGDNVFSAIKTDDPININFRLNGNDELKAKGRVLRTKETGIAIKFKGLDPALGTLIKDYVG